MKKYSFFLAMTKFGRPHRRNDNENKPFENASLMYSSRCPLQLPVTIKRSGGVLKLLLVVYGSLLDASTHSP